MSREISLMYKDNSFKIPNRSGGDKTDYQVRQVSNSKKRE